MRAHVEANNVIPLVRGRQSWRFTQSDLIDLRRIFPMGDFVPGADAGTAMPSSCLKPTMAIWC